MTSKKPIQAADDHAAPAASNTSQSVAGGSGKTPQDIINEIMEKSEGEAHIFRGESRRYDQPVSSSLYRELCLNKQHGAPMMSAQYFAALNDEETMIKAARRYIASDHLSNIDIVTLLQHYGCPTAHIDCSGNIPIAVFHACGGADEGGEAAAQAGIVYIFAARLFHHISGDISYNGEERRRNILVKSSRREPRALSQSSLFVRAYRGFLPPELGKQVIIPAEMKRAVLDYLRKNFSISGQTVYFDIHGFIGARRYSLTARRHLHKGLETHAEGEYSRALACYEAAAELCPEWALLHYNRGLTWYEVGDYGRAIQDYDEAIGLEPDMEKAYVNRGIAKGKTGDPDGAIADFNRAIGINPAFAEAYILCGQAKIKQGDIDGGIIDFDRALRINPELPEAYINRGEARSGQGKFDMAIADCDKAISINERLLGISRGNTVKSIGNDIAGVVVDFNALFPVIRSLYEAYFIRGTAKMNKKDSAGAAADFRERERIASLLLGAYMRCGRVKYRKHYIDGAIVDYDSALGLNPEFTEAYYARGIAKHSKRKFADAKEDFEQALRLARQQGKDELCNRIRRWLNDTASPE